MEVPVNGCDRHTLQRAVTTEETLADTRVYLCNNYLACKRRQPCQIAIQHFELTSLVPFSCQFFSFFYYYYCEIAHYRKFNLQGLTGPELVNLRR